MTLRKSVAICLLVALASAGCKRGPGGFACPNQFNPRRMSMRQIRAANIASIPERAATTLANVRQAERKARRFIKDNYPGVTDIGVGRGWGVSFTRDAYGNETFHRAPDYMVVIVVESRSQCPDPKRGTLFLFGNDGLRTPSQFLYKRAR